MEADGSRTYRPLNAVNRDAMAAFLYRLAGKPAFTPPATSPFTDITPSSQFYKEITWLAASGISTGWTEQDGSKTYRPLSPVNRDAMAAFLYRFGGAIPRSRRRAPHRSWTSRSEASSTNRSPGWHRRASPLVGTLATAAVPTTRFSRGP